MVGKLKSHRKDNESGHGNTKRGTEEETNSKTHEQKHRSRRHGMEWGQRIGIRAQCTLYSSFPRLPIRSNQKTKVSLKYAEVGHKTMTWAFWVCVKAWPVCTTRRNSIRTSIFSNDLQVLYGYFLLSGWIDLRLQYIYNIWYIFSQSLYSINSYHVHTW